MKNYYGSLCTEMYEILHESAPGDELNFYLSYAEKGMSILEPLFGSGRFLIPFLERGFEICGLDLSEEMLAKLKKKAPQAKFFQGNILEYESKEKFDYIFISSGSVSLFTDIDVCKKILWKMKELLKPGGKFVFAVDSIKDRCEDDEEYKTSIEVKTKEGFDLVLKGKNRFDEETNTQYSPSVYELYRGSELLQKEEMDFQTHLYELGELEPYLEEIGFSKVTVYCSYEKEIAQNNETNMFLYECSL